eukprot:4909604-Pleurochrysis_carterae.AAC.1
MLERRKTKRGAGGPNDCICGEGAKAKDTEEVVIASPNNFIWYPFPFVVGMLAPTVLNRVSQTKVRRFQSFRKKLLPIRQKRIPLSEPRLPDRLPKV